MRNVSRIAAALGLLAYPAGAWAGDPVSIDVGTTPFANASTNVQPTISIDSLWLARPTVFTSASSTIAQHLKTLAGPYPVKRLRIGAIGADKTYWSRSSTTADPTPSWATRGRITPAGIAALDKLSQDAGGYGIVLHTNLEQYDPDYTEILPRMADMVSEADRVLGNRLTAVVVGNEPDLYDGGNMPTSTFWSRWKKYRDTFRAKVPGLALYGPATAQEGDFFDAFVTHQTAGVSIGALASHDYYLSMCSTQSQAGVTIPRLLSYDLYQTTRGEAQYVASQARRLNVPAVWDERNSVSCGGKQGVSDVYAAALWGLDSTLLIARSGISRQYLHSAFGVCGTAKPFNTWYSAFCSETQADADVGRIKAQPLFYGLLAAHVVGDGTFLNSSVTDESQARLRFYALQQESRMSLVLVNVEGSATTATVTVPQAYTSASRADLTGPSLTATSGIALGGGTMQADGTFSGTNFTPVALSNGGRTVSVSVPANSAAIIRLD